MVGRWETAKAATTRAEFDDRQAGKSQAAFIEYQKTTSPSGLRNKHLGSLARAKLITVKALADARAGERDAKEAFEKAERDLAFAQNQCVQKEQEYKSLVADIGKLSSGENDSPTYN
jgi:hypothetical protein